MTQREKDQLEALEDEIRIDAISRLDDPESDGTLMLEWADRLHAIRHGDPEPEPTS